MGLNWVFDKLREWVGTVTGKGVSWGRDSVGRSAPALMAASTTVLPPLTCTARGRRHLRQLLFLLRSRPSVGRSLVVRPEPGGESAGCVCLQCCSAGCVLPACHFACHAHCPSQHLAPVQFACPRPVPFCFVCPVHSMCARIVVLGPAVCCQGQQFASC